METWEEYKKELDNYREELENGNYDVEQDVLDLEMKIELELQEMADYDDLDDTPYKKLLQELRSLKREFDFYDADGELDRMFPDRHDEDFDDDSMSYDSVFGDD